MNQIFIGCGNYQDYCYITPYIRYCEEDRYKSHWELPLRKLGDYEFVLITRGTGIFSINDCIHNVKAGSLILLKPGVPHSAVSLQLPFEFLCIHFDLYVSKAMNTLKEERQNAYEAIPASPVKYSKADLDFPDFSVAPEYAGILLKRIVLEAKGKHKGYNIVIKALFTELLFSLFRGIDDSTDMKIRYPDEIIKIMEFIKSNYMKKLHLKDAAADVHLHHTYVSALFKKHTGLTFTDFLTMHRLSAARMLLLESDKKLEEIALITGFCDIHHFSKVFKAHEGLSPSQYRQIRH